jgi:hypothetical protein
MIAFNPTVQDRSGELIAGGISQAAQGISGAISQLSDLKMKASQADATAGVAQKMGIFNSQQDPDGTQALAMIQATPWYQKASITPYLLQMAGTKALMNWHMDRNQIKQEELNMKGDAAGAKAVPMTLY